MYGNFVGGFGTCCTISGINICGSSVGHSNILIGGLKGGPPSEFPLGEFPSCPPFSGW
jgi:hypothetical protein